jgi:hypothetical protein
MHVRTFLISLPTLTEQIAVKNQVRVETDLASIGVRLGVCAAALGGVAGSATDAFGQIVSFTTPVPIPQTFAGVYINFLTGQTSTVSAGSLPGWDFNPYSRGAATGLGFFWNNTAPNISAGVAATTTGPYLHLPDGTTVDGASTFSSTIAGTVGSPYLTTGTNTLGFRFINENTGQTNFGYLTIETTATLGFPATITGWSFESSGAPIIVTTPVPEPATIGLTCAAMVAGATGLRRWRREKQSAPTVAA